MWGQPPPAATSSAARWLFHRPRYRPPPDSPKSFLLFTIERLPMDLAAIQSALRERNIDAWLFYDHHHRDPIAYRVLGLPAGLMVTRRWFYLIPAEGEPIKLVHKIEAGHLDSLPGKKHQVFRLAGAIRPTEVDSGETSRSGHAVFAQQQRFHDFAGGWRHHRPAARPGQKYCQFGGSRSRSSNPPGPKHRSPRTSPRATASIP